MSARWFLVVTAVLALYILSACRNSDQQAKRRTQELEATVAALQRQLSQTPAVITTATQARTSQASATSTPTPSTTASATQRTESSPTPPVVALHPPAGTILYEADWSTGHNGWPSAFGWKAFNGTLLNDASNDNGSKWLPAPYAPGRDGIADFAVEAEIQVVRGAGFLCSDRIIGLVASDYNVRAGINAPGCGDTAKIFVGGDTVASQGFSPHGDFHVYRLQVKGLHTTFLADGALIGEATDTRYLNGGQVGLWDANLQVAVRSFRVIAL